MTTIENHPVSAQTHATGKPLASRLALPALLLLVCAINVLLMPRQFLPGDPFCWREEARGILRDGSLSVDPVFADSQNEGQNGKCFVLNNQNGRWYNKIGVMNALMSLPPLVVDRMRTGAIGAPGSAPDIVDSDCWGVLLTLIVCWLLWLVSGRYTARAPTRALFVLGVF